MSGLATSGITHVPAPVPGAMGGRRRRSAKKLRLVKKKTVRRMLAAKGLKMRGGGDPSPAPEAAKSGPAPTTGTMGGRRHRKSHRKSHRRGTSLFGMRF
jgi:hypothetical protein